MSTTINCFGCGEQIAATPGNYYCGTCVEKQLEEERDEAKGFDDLHAYADAAMMSDDTLLEEIAFADRFNWQAHPPAVRWQTALRNEARRRGLKDAV